MKEKKTWIRERLVFGNYWCSGTINFKLSSVVVVVVVSFGSICPYFPLMSSVVIILQIWPSYMSNQTRIPYFFNQSSLRPCAKSQLWIGLSISCEVCC